MVADSAYAMCRTTQAKRQHKYTFNSTHAHAGGMTVTPIAVFPLYCLCQMLLSWLCSTAVLQTIFQKAAKPAGSLAGPWLCLPCLTTGDFSRAFHAHLSPTFSDVLFCIKKSSDIDHPSLLPLLNVLTLLLH